jgi:hypothetical protein
MDDLTIEVTVTYTVKVDDERINRVLVDRRDDGCRDGIFLEDVRDVLANDSDRSRDGALVEYLNGCTGLGLEDAPYTRGVNGFARLYSLEVDPNDFLQCLIEDMSGRLVTD